MIIAFFIRHLQIKEQKNKLIPDSYRDFRKDVHFFDYASPNICFLPEFNLGFSFPSPQVFPFLPHNYRKLFRVLNYRNEITLEKINIFAAAIQHLIVTSLNSSWIIMFLYLLNWFFLQGTCSTSAFCFFSFLPFLNYFSGSLVIHYFLTILSVDSDKMSEPGGPFTRSETCLIMYYFIHQC